MNTKLIVRKDITNLMHRHIGQERNDVVNYRDDKTGLILVLAGHDLDVVSHFEPFSNTPRRNINLLTFDVQSNGAQRYNVVVDGINNTMYTRLFTLEYFDMITRL